MSERKNIERLYQEKFKDFEATPPPGVWDNIALGLEKEKKKKRGIPFWYKIAGVAAIMLFGFFTVDQYTPFFNKNSTIDHSLEEVVVGTNNNANSTTTNQDNTSIKNTPQEPILGTEKTVISQNNLHPNKQSIVANDDKKSMTQKPSKVTNQSFNNTIVSNDKSSKINTKKDIVSNSKEETKKANIILNNAFISNEKSSKINTKKNIVASSNAKEETKNNGILSNDKKAYSFPKKSNTAKNVAVNTQILKNTNDPDYHILSKKKQDKAISENNNFKNEFIKKETETVFDKNSQLITPIVKNNTVDSLKIIRETENPLEKILKEKQNKKEKIVAVNAKKWSLRPNVAPVIMNATGGSPIGSQFVNNGKEYKNSLSVGLGLDYKVSKKVAIRTGINQFSLGYNTTGIAYYADLGNARAIARNNNLEAVNLNAQAENMIIENPRNNAPSANDLALSAGELASQNKNQGYLNQRTGYLEVPIEVSYKLLDKRFGIAVFTGFSTLFLNENKISLVSTGLTTEIGEANNLNKVHFSTNLGLGFKYRLWKSLEANFDPTLKYQVNTYNANSGGFKPYFVGLYSGLSYTF
jgi:Outer membrane protein beta-barrel domain